MRRRQHPSDEKMNKHRIEAEIEFEKPNHIDDRMPAKQPKFEKRERGGPYQPGKPAN